MAKRWVGGGFVGLLFSGLAACGEGGDDDAGDADAGSGGSAAVGASGGAPAGGGGTGGSASGAGGSAGSAGMPVCPAGLMEFGAADADLTLGDLNADLPAPSLDCLSAKPSDSTCIALSLEIDGVVRELICTGLHVQATAGTGVTCDTDAGEYLNLQTNNFGGITVPGTFTTSQTEPTFGGLLKIELADGAVDGDDDGFVETRIAGWVNKWVESNYCRNASWGAIAASWAESELGAVRVRGTFHTRSY